MIWYKNLYIGDSILEKKEIVLDKIQHNVLQPGIYVIVLAENGKDNFRIIHSLEFLQKSYPKDDLFVIGVAGGKQEAYELVTRMVQDVLDATGSPAHAADYFRAPGGRV
ncbi:MAG: hypothetical protein ACI39H_05710 [Lachnospiraceae bacterium]